MWSVWLVFCDCGFHSVALWQIRIRGLWKLPDGRDWLCGKLGKLCLVLMDKAMLNKSLVQFSVGGHGYVPSMLSNLRPSYGGGNEDNDDLWKGSMQALLHSVSWPCSRPPLILDSPRDSWILTGKSGSVSCGITAPFSWILVHTRFCLCPPRVCFPSPVEVL